jgi:hypothetical protein
MDTVNKVTDVAGVAWEAVKDAASSLTYQDVKDYFDFRVNQWGEKQRDELFKEYLDSYDKVGKLEAKGTHRAYIDIVLAEFEKSFKSHSLPDGSTQEKKLADTNQATQTATAAVKKAFTDVISTTDAETIKANQHFRRVVGVLLNSKDKHAALLADQFKLLKDTTTEDMKRSSEVQKAKLESLYDNGAFQKNLKEMGLNPDQVADHKKKMVEDFTKAHEAGVKKFNEDAEQTIKSLHIHAANERWRVSTFARLYMDSTANRNVINKLAKVDPDQQAAGIQLTSGEKKNQLTAIFKGLRIQDMEQIKIAGYTATYNKGDESFSVNIPEHWLNNKDVNVIAKLIAIARANAAPLEDPKNPDKPVKPPQINFSVQTREGVKEGVPGKQALKSGMIAFKECLKAGYDRDRIKITVNGVVYSDEVQKNKKKKEKQKSISDLFAGNTLELEAALNEHTSEQAKKKTYENAFQNTESYKKQLGEFKEAVQAKEIEENQAQVVSSGPQSRSI